MDAPTLRCSACGGALPDGVGLCPFCRSTVAARRCLSCFHANLSSAEHCAACGRGLGLEPVAEPESMACPACAIPFVAVPAASRGQAEGLVHECPRCRGQFVDHATLRALCEERLAMAEAPRSARKPAATLGPVRYLPCPVCKARMNRKNFGERSGVVVDVCKHHGSWFDDGELPAVLAFVEAGGLREADRRAEQRKADEVRAAASAAFTARHDPHDVHGGAGDGESLLGLLRALLS